MARKLFNFGLAWVLVLGCWGGVLAAAACPHVGCETAAAAPVEAGTHGAHSAVETREPAVAGDHCARAKAGQGHAAQPPDAGRDRPESEDLRGTVLAPRGTSCSHCVGRRQEPPSTKSDWQFNSARKVEKDSAAPAVGRPQAFSRAFVREVIPAQHAPPPKPGRHLLLGVFLI